MYLGSFTSEKNMYLGSSTSEPQDDDVDKTSTTTVLEAGWPSLIKRCPKLLAWPKLLSWAPISPCPGQ